MYLVDTDVLSLAAPTKAQPRKGLAGWLRDNGGHLYLSVITLGEIEYGVARLRHRGANRKASLLDAWATTIRTFYAARIVDVDIPVARLAAQMRAGAQANGHHPGIDDSRIAASADILGMTVLTANLRDFLALGVAAIDPTTELPPNVGG